MRRRAEELRRGLRGGPWTREEQRSLKKLYGTRRDEDLEVCLQRDRAEIQLVAKQLCLAKDKRFRANAQGAMLSASSGSSSMPRWTADDVVRLRMLYPHHDNLTVARELGRTVTSVANKAYQLGIKKSSEVLADIGRRTSRSATEALSRRRPRSLPRASPRPDPERPAVRPAQQRDFGAPLNLRDPLSRWRGSALRTSRVATRGYAMEIVGKKSQGLNVTTLRDDRTVIISFNDRSLNFYVTDSLKEALKEAINEKIEEGYEPPLNLDNVKIIDSCGVGRSLSRTT